MYKRKYQIGRAEISGIYYCSAKIRACRKCDDIMDNMHKDRYEYPAGAQIDKAEKGSEAEGVKDLQQGIGK